MSSSNLIVNYSMVFCWPFKACRKCSQGSLLLKCSPTVLHHLLSSRRVQYVHGIRDIKGMMHVKRSFGKVILVCVEIEGLKEPRLRQKEISTVLFKCGISKSPGPEFHDSDPWSHKNIEKVEWIMVKYFRAWPEIAHMIASVAGMHLNRGFFPPQNKHMCSALHTAHGWQTHRAWSDRQEYWDACEERRDSLN